jgi:hypothetical protein
LLNKIEIGQFLYMKYRVGIRQKIDQYNTIESEVFGSEENLSLMSRIMAINPIEDIMEKPHRIGIESFSDLPLALKKPYFLSNLTSCICLTINGTPKIPSHRERPANSLLSLKYSLSITHKVTPSQNIKFQKLSLFSRDLIKLIISSVHILKYKIISFIVSRFKDVRKTIRLLLAILMVNFSFISCFAEDLAELIDKTEQDYAIPSGLLKSIASVESGNKPYALNISGKTVFANSKEEAARIVRLYQDEGVTNIDLGLAQINLHWHGENFKSIEQMLEPKHNIEYAAKFLSKLYRQHGSWNKAVRHYHSANPHYHIKYSRKVLISWLGSGS